jgi:glyoxylase-like metal-dependent hydrolase (beta-lactamase superfamily II)
MWNKVSPADEDNRVTLACNLLLIETPNGRVLVETGMGPRWTEKERQRYDLKTLVDHERLLDGLSLENDDVDAVIISHLHFDHAGGAVINRDGKLLPTFPKAKYYVQKGEWDFSTRANARAKASYRAEDLEPLEAAGALVFMDGNTEVLPGVSVHLTGGHTTHHQVVVFESKGNKGVYFADIIPTKSHIPPPWVMGYDHYPLASCDFKSEWLAKAARENWLVVFDHEIEVPWGHVHCGDKDKFTWEALAPETLVHPQLLNK